MAPSTSDVIYEMSSLRTRRSAKCSFMGKCGFQPAQFARFLNPTKKSMEVMNLMNILSCLKQESYAIC